MGQDEVGEECCFVHPACSVICDKDHLLNQSPLETSVPCPLDWHQETCSSGLELFDANCYKHLSWMAWGVWQTLSRASQSLWKATDDGCYKYKRAASPWSGTYYWCVTVGPTSSSWGDLGWANEACAKPDDLGLRDNAGEGRRVDGCTHEHHKRSNTWTIWHTNGRTLHLFLVHFLVSQNFFPTQRKQTSLFTLTLLKRCTKLRSAESICPIIPHFFPTFAQHSLETFAQGN